jgi:hypothetical protein
LQSLGRSRFLRCADRHFHARNRHLKAGDAKLLARAPAADPRVKSSTTKLSTSELLDLFVGEARKDRRKGWTSWQTSSGPEWRIKHDWGCNLRELHNLRRNSTELFNADGELVGEIRWRQLEHWWRMKRPPAGYQPPRRAPADIVREMKDWINERRVARGEPPLPDVGASKLAKAAA